MNNLFENERRHWDIITAFKLPRSTPLWGKMNVAQMMAIRKVPIEVALGEKN